MCGAHMVLMCVCVYACVCVHRWMCKILMFFSHFVLLCSIAIIWLLIPTDFNVREPLALQISNYLPAQIAQDSNSNFEFVIGKDAYVVQPEFDPAYLIQIQTALAEPGTPGYGKRRMARELLARTLAGDIDTSAHPDGWDPVGLTDEDLKSNDPLTTWHRQLLQSADVANVAANLTGGLLVRDHVKYNMPMAYSITNLAWALETFPEGYTALQKVEVLRVIRAGAEYLMRCLLRLKNGEYVYVAQVGDGRHYVPVTDPATSVEQSDLIWTAPQLDPYLNGQRFRKVRTHTHTHMYTCDPSFPPLLYTTRKSQATQRPLYICVCLCPCVCVCVRVSCGHTGVVADGSQRRLRSPGQRCGSPRSYLPGLPPRVPVLRHPGIHRGAAPLHLRRADAPRPTPPLVLRIRALHNQHNRQ